MAPHHDGLRNLQVGAQHLHAPFCVFVQCFLDWVVAAVPFSEGKLEVATWNDLNSQHVSLNVQHITSTLGQRTPYATSNTQCYGDAGDASTATALCASLGLAIVLWLKILQIQPATMLYAKSTMPAVFFCACMPRPCMSFLVSTQAAPPMKWHLSLRS